MSRNWLAVASAEHVEIGRSAGFMQVCHGKASPLRRVQPGDRVVYYSPNRVYSPSHALRGKDRLQAFTAIGTVKQGALYQADMGFGFQPYPPRRRLARRQADADRRAAGRAGLHAGEELGLPAAPGPDRDQRRRHDDDRRGDVHSLGSTSSASRWKVSRLSGAHIR